MQAAFAGKLRMELLGQLDDLPHPCPARQHGYVGDEADILHEPVAVTVRPFAEHFKFTAEAGQTQNGFQRGGFSGPVGTDQADDAARWNIQVNAVNRSISPVMTFQAAGSYGQTHGLFSLLFLAATSSSIDTPSCSMRSARRGHSSVRKRSRSLSSKRLRAPSRTNMPTPRRFSTRSSSTRA